MESDLRRRLREKSDELLAEADRLDAIERTLDALPEGSNEIVETAEHAEGQAARLRDIASEDEALTREVVETAGTQKPANRER
jgi:hypothetical protein